MSALPGPLPPLYARWMDELLAAPIPNESRATCNDCAMWLKPADAPDQPPPVVFRRDTKCCTFQPELHNFLLGAILDDPDRGLAWAKEMIAVRLLRRTGVTPLGLRPDAFAGLLYDRIVDGARETFGRLREVRCPYYIEQGGKCGVWRHRNAMCSTWFCKYERGAVGMTFWKTQLALLRAAERALALWCVLELDLGITAKTTLLYLQNRDGSSARDLVEPVPEHGYQALWGSYVGRELELYRECARLVAGLSWADVRRIAGPDLALLEDVVKEQYAALVSDALPAAVQRGRDTLLQLHPTKPDHYRAVAPNLGYDPLDLPAKTLEVLPEVVGRELGEALATLHASGRGSELDETSVRTLLDYGVLAPSRAPA